MAKYKHDDLSPNAEDHQHYFLTVTERMLTTQLAQKLLWVADRMTEITDARKAL